MTESFSKVTALLEAEAHSHHARPKSGRQSSNKDTLVARSSLFFAEAALDDSDDDELISPRALNGNSFTLPTIQVTVDCENNGYPKRGTRDLSPERASGKDITFEAAHTSSPKRKTRREKKEEVLEKYKVDDATASLLRSPLLSGRKLAQCRILSGSVQESRKLHSGLPNIKVAPSRGRSGSLGNITTDIQNFIERRDKCRDGTRPLSSLAGCKALRGSRPRTGSLSIDEFPSRLTIHGDERCKSPTIRRSRSQTLPANVNGFHRPDSRDSNQYLNPPEDATMLRPSSSWRTLFRPSHPKPLALSVVDVEVAITAWMSVLHSHRDANLCTPNVKPCNWSTNGTSLRPFCHCIEPLGKQVVNWTCGNKRCQQNLVLSQVVHAGIETYFGRFVYFKTFSSYLGLPH